MNAPSNEPDPASSAAARKISWVTSTPLRYPRLYLSFLAVSSLDITMTWVILGLGGIEVNPIARRVIDLWGLPGAIAFKFSLMLFVILVCEIVGREKNHVGHGLALLSVIVSAMPVIYSVGLVAMHMTAIDQAPEMVTMMLR